MQKTKTALWISLVVATSSFAEKIPDGHLSVERLYLKYRTDDFAYDEKFGFRLVDHPYFGYDSNCTGGKVDYFGGNLAKEMEPVPKANHIMTGYMFHRIGTYVGIAAGIGLIAYTFNKELKSDSNKNADGTYSSAMPTGFKVGFGCIGLGLGFELTKSFYLDAAINAYNEHAAK